MHYLPIAERELRLAARHWRTYWGRFAVALMALAVAGYASLALELGNVPPAQVGAMVFQVLAWLAMGYCLVAGFATVDSLSREKREGTLGFLFLTDLRGYDVVVGQLAAKGLRSLLGVMAMVPVLAVSLMLGGVTGVMLVRTVVALLNILFLSLAGGLLVSAVSRDQRKAASGLVLLLFCLCAFLPWVAALMGSVNGAPPWMVVQGFLRCSSPIVAFSLATGAGRAFGWIARDPYWVSMASLHLQAWLFAGLAAWITPRVWKERPAGGRWKQLVRAWHWVLFGDGRQRQARREKLLDVNPVCWLSSRERWKAPALWSVLGVAVVGWLIGWRGVGREWLAPQVGIMMALCLHGVLKYWLAAETCRRFAEDRENGAFELVLSTSLTVPQILRGQWLAMLRLFGGPWIVVGVLDLVLLAFAVRGGGWGSEAWQVPWVFGAGVFFLGVHLIALGWVGMWQGLSAKSLNQAVTNTVFQILLLPWLAYWLIAGAIVLAQELLLQTMGPARMPMVRVWNPTFATMFALWFALMLGLNLMAAVWARRRLRREFRSLAGQRFARPRRWHWVAQLLGMRPPAREGERSR